MTGQLHLRLSVCKKEGIQLWYVAGGCEERAETGKGNLLNRRTICNMEQQLPSHILKRKGGKMVRKKPGWLTDKGKPAQNYCQARGKKLSTFIHLHGGPETFRHC